MNEPMQDLSEAGLVAAIEANMFALRSLWGGTPHVETHDDPEMLWSTSSTPIPIFNTVMRAHLSPGSVDAAIETVIARYKSRNVPVLWLTGPATRPADLGVYLQAHGFTSEGDFPGMAVDLQALNENLPALTGLTVESVNDSETLKVWQQVLTGVFGASEITANAFYEIWNGMGFSEQAPVRYYVARLNGQPVATSLLFLGAGVAGIYSVTTIPAARRLGIGAHVTLAPLRDARRKGYRVGVLRATAMGAGVYRRLGFQEYCRIGEYVWQRE